MLSINWAKKETPVTIEIEDVQVLIAASSATEYSRDDEEMREQQLKMERLERAEAMRMGQVTGTYAKPVYFHPEYLCCRGRSSRSKLLVLRFFRRQDCQ